MEFAFVAPVLFMLLMGTIEGGLVLTADVMLKHATYTASRTGRTGYSTSETTRDELVRQIIEEQAGILMDTSKIDIDSKSYDGFDTLSAPEPFVDANENGVRDDGENYTDVNGNGQYDGATVGIGDADSVVVYTVTYPWTFFTPLIGDLMGTDGVLTLTATAIVQNEPWS
ncbi:TadE/TadG family type IV pilus assembly protein [Consotaella aegiceratis]|uniref:TadE/TadG family type IV pilus assembly protein n=1 Tax=Consotaella aegiceratis TaxID=3097961 RepID=UPI002F3E4866